MYARKTTSEFISVYVIVIVIVIVIVGRSGVWELLEVEFSLRRLLLTRDIDIIDH